MWLITYEVSSGESVELRRGGHTTIENTVYKDTATTRHHPIKWRESVLTAMKEEDPNSETEINIIFAIEDGRI